MTIETPQTWAAKNAARLIIYGTLFVVLIGTAWYIKHRLDKAESLEQTVQVQGDKAEATSGIAEDLGEATAGQQTVEVRISNDTRQLARDLEELRRANPDLDHWLRADIPDQLRQLACQRRIARDRSGAAEAGSGAADQGATAAGPGDQSGGCDNGPGIVRADDRP